MTQLLDLIKENPSTLYILLFTLSLCVEIAPIKINPISWIIKAIKKNLTKDVHKEYEEIKKENEEMKEEMDNTYHIKSKHYEETLKWREETNNVIKELENVNKQLIETMNKLDEKIDEMYEGQDEDEMRSLRWEILSFADMLKSGFKYSKQSFHHIIECDDRYHKIIEKRGFANGVIDEEMKYILEVYRKCRDDDDFA